MKSTDWYMTLPHQFLVCFYLFSRGHVTQYCLEIDIILLCSYIFLDHRFETPYMALYSFIWICSSIFVLANKYCGRFHILLNDPPPGWCLLFFSRTCQSANERMHVSQNECNCGCALFIWSKPENLMALPS